MPVIQEIKVITKPIGDASAEVHIVETSKSPFEYTGYIILYEPSVNSHQSLLIPIEGVFNNSVDVFDCAVQKISDWSVKYSRTIDSFHNICGFGFLSQQKQLLIVSGKIPNAKVV